RNLPHRVRQHLAVLGGEDLRDLLAALVHELADVEEEPGPLREREGAPRRRGLLRSLDGLVDLLRRGEVDGAGLAPGRGIEHHTAAAGAAGDAAAADPVADARSARALLDGRGCKLGHSEASLSPSAYRA